MEHRKRRGGKSNSLPLSIVGGMGGGFLVGLILVLCCAMVVYRTSNPTALVLPLGLICLAVSSLVCGFLSTKLWGHKSLAPALIAGTIFGVLIVAGGLCIPGSTLPLALRIAGVPIILVLSLLGGGMTMKKKGRRHPR